MFSQYNDEFLSLATGIEEGLDHAAHLEDVDEARNVFAKCEQDLKTADSLVKQMEVEARMDGSGTNKRSASEAKRRLKSLREGRERVAQTLERAELFSGGGQDGYVGLSQTATQDRSRFEEATARMDRSSEALLETRRVLAETEDVAMGITENLSSNRSLIIRARERVADTGGLIGNASQILRRMRNQRTRRKAILACLILFLVVMIIVMLSYALAPASTDSGSANIVDEKHRLLRAVF